MEKIRKIAQSALEMWKHGVKWGKKHRYEISLACAIVAIGAVAVIFRNGGGVPVRGKTGSTPLPDSVSAAAERLLVVATDAPQPTATPQSEEYGLPCGGKVLRGDSEGALVYWEALSLWQTHEGCDYAAAEGEAVCAVWGGIVEDAYKDSLWGYVIQIAQSDGKTAVYASLGTLQMVEIGQKVEKGQIISTASDTAACESDMGVHVHVAVS